MNPRRRAARHARFIYSPDLVARGAVNVAYDVGESTPNARQTRARFVTPVSPQLVVMFASVKSYRPERSAAVTGRARVSITPIKTSTAVRARAR